MRLIPDRLSLVSETRKNLQIVAVSSVLARASEAPPGQVWFGRGCLARSRNLSAFREISSHQNIAGCLFYNQVRRRQTACEVRTPNQTVNYLTEIKSDRPKIVWKASFQFG